jgi:hypothetical protein
VNLHVVVMTRRRVAVMIARMLTALREAVEERIEQGDELERIEAEVVDPAPLDEERRAALWLYAWCRAQEALPERRAAPARAHIRPSR